MDFFSKIFTSSRNCSAILSRYILKSPSYINSSVSFGDFISIPNFGPPHPKPSKYITIVSEFAFLSFSFMYCLASSDILTGIMSNHQNILLSYLIYKCCVIIMNIHHNRIINKIEKDVG